MPPKKPPYAYDQKARMKMRRVMNAVYKQIKAVKNYTECEKVNVLDEKVTDEACRDTPYPPPPPPVKVIRLISNKTPISEMTVDMVTSDMAKLLMYGEEEEEDDAKLEILAKTFLSMEQEKKPNPTLDLLMKSVDGVVQEQREGGNHEWMLRNDNNLDPLNTAAMNNDLETFYNLLKNCDKQRINNSKLCRCVYYGEKFFTNPLVIAATYGYTQIVELVYADAKNGDRHTKNAILHWNGKMNPRRKINSHLGILPCEIAIFYGHADVLRVLWSEPEFYVSSGKQCRYSGYVYTFETYNNYYKPYFLGNLSLAAASGNIDTVAEVLNRTLVDPLDFHQAMREATKHGNSAMVTLLFKHSPIPPDQLLSSLIVAHPEMKKYTTITGLMTPVHLACFHGHLPLVQWYYDICPQAFDLKADEFNAYEWAQLNCNYDVAEFLESKKKDNCNPYHMILSESIRNGTHAFAMNCIDHMNFTMGSWIRVCEEVSPGHPLACALLADNYSLMDYIMFIYRENNIMELQDKEEKVWEDMIETTIIALLRKIEGDFTLVKQMAVIKTMIDHGIQIQNILPFRRNKLLENSPILMFVTNYARKPLDVDHDVISANLTYVAENMNYLIITDNNNNADKNINEVEYPEGYEVEEL